MAHYIRAEGKDKILYLCLLGQKLDFSWSNIILMFLLPLLSFLMLQNTIKITKYSHIGIILGLHWRA